MSPTKTIEAVLGQPVQITLQSMAGSTGYSWNLVQLEGGLALNSASYALISEDPGRIAPVNQVFDFIAIQEGTFKVAFALLAPWRPGEAADTLAYDVTISQAKLTAAEDIEAAMKGRDFISAAAVQVGACDATSMVLKYAAPMVKYAAPMAMSGSMKYAAPMPMVLKYAAPTRPVLKYAAPYLQGMDPCQAAAFQSGAQDACDPCGAFPSTNALYAAPMVLGSQQVQPPFQILYAAPMTVQQGQSNFPMPMTWPPYPVPMAMPRPLYAAPMVQALPANQSIIMPYAAPYTYQGYCC